MQKNATKSKLKSGETVFGSFLRQPDPSLVEVLGYQDWDFIVFDGEHGTLEPRDCENLVRAAELRKVTPIVRVTTNLAPIILRFMDTGAQGLHIPWINSAEEAERAVRSVKYHPRGIRGLAGVRAADYALAMPFSKYVQQANAETLIVIHIETAEAVERLPEIVEVDGLDVIFIGPTDLSHSLGVPGQLEHPRLQKTIQRIFEITEGSKVALGTLAGNAEIACRWRERGVRYIVTSFESMLTRAAKDFLQTVRS